jgi:hypothetical protein
MGFSGYPPQWTLDSILANIDHWSPRSELSISHDEPPWGELLSGISAEFLVQREKVPIVNLYRSKGLKFVFVGDPTNGWDRSQESNGLKSLGRSLTEPAVQKVYRDYMLAISKLLNPDIIFLAAETNAIRLVAPKTLYEAVKTSANKAAEDLIASNCTSMLGISVQVEVAWGLFSGNVYQGISIDEADFPFVDVTGLSSYPYFFYKTPESIPWNYYSRLRKRSGLPMAVIEGGWNSMTVDLIQSSEQMQASYIDKHASLLDSIDAIGWITLLYADPVDGMLPPSFRHIGLTHSDWSPKAALPRWDTLFARPHL